ncbi:MAG: MFS transporter [Bacteroidales bacterium]|nr:MFS transporter [Bacteroidales bacterium]
MQQKTNRSLTYTILSISLLTVMAGAAMAPALGVIREHFTAYSDLMVQFIVSLPALFIIVTNLLFSWLCKLMKTKTLAIVGLSLYVLAGAGAYFIDNIWLLLFFRALLGVSVGMVMPLSTGLLAYYFPPEQQASLMGLSAAMNQMGGAVATLLSGFLAGISWNCAFLVYLLGLISLGLVVAFLPNERLAKDKVENAEKQSIGKLMKKFHPSVVGMLLAMALFFIYPTNFAITSLSNTALSSNTITLIMVGLDLIAFVGGLFFGQLMRPLRKSMKYVAPVGFLLGYFFLSLDTTIGLLILGSVFIGIANAMSVPYLNTIASIKGGKDAATTVMPLISAALYLGQFLSPLVVNPCSRLLGGVTAPYQVGVIMAVLFLIQTICTRKYQMLPPEER